MREMELENGKLKRMYAELALENHALKDLIEKKLRPPEKEAVEFLITAKQVMGSESLFDAQSVPVELSPQRYMTR